MSARPPCVRCGRGERVPTLFICAACQSDPATRAEIDAAARRSPDYVKQRRYLVARRHWAGEWTRADEARIGARL